MPPLDIEAQVFATHRNFFPSFLLVYYLFSKDVSQDSSLLSFCVDSLLARLSTPPEPYPISHYNLKSICLRCSLANVMLHDSPKGGNKQNTRCQTFWKLGFGASLARSGAKGQSPRKSFKNTRFCNKK